MQNHSRDEFEQIPKMRRLKNYTKMSKEGLIIALLKPERSLAELSSNNYNNDRIKGVKKSLNEVTDRLFEPEIKKLGKIFIVYKKEESF